MGDHHIGEAMRNGALLWWETHHQRPSQIEAMTALDIICEPYRGRDAEFESEDPARPDYINPAYEMDTDPDGPIGRLIAIAFDATSAEMSLGDNDICPWFDGPYTRFRQRYRFC